MKPFFPTIQTKPLKRINSRNPPLEAFSRTSLQTLNSKNSISQSTVGLHASKPELTGVVRTLAKGQIRTLLKSTAPPMLSKSDPKSMRASINPTQQDKTFDSTMSKELENASRPRMHVYSAVATSPSHQKRFKAYTFMSTDKKVSVSSTRMPHATKPLTVAKPPYKERTRVTSYLSAG